MTFEHPKLSSLERQALAERRCTTRFQFLELENSYEFSSGKDEVWFVCHFREKGSERKYSFECRQVESKKVETFPIITRNA